MIQQAGFNPARVTYNSWQCKQRRSKGLYFRNVEKEKKRLNRIELIHKTVSRASLRVLAHELGHHFHEPHIEYLTTPSNEYYAETYCLDLMRKHKLYSPQLLAEVKRHLRKHCLLYEKTSRVSSARAPGVVARFCGHKTGKPRVSSWVKYGGEPKRLGRWQNLPKYEASYEDVGHLLKAAEEAAFYVFSVVETDGERIEWKQVTLSP